MFTRIIEAQSRQKRKKISLINIHSDLNKLFVPNNGETKVKHETYLLGKHHKRTLLKT